MKRTHAIAVEDLARILRAERILVDALREIADMTRADAEDEAIEVARSALARAYPTEAPCEKT